ncbi:MAG TPA: alpha/beta hydrolase [Sphingomonas sp.]|nr:alpha/beta hydrolase [Sphingomonas sp.]
MPYILTDDEIELYVKAWGPEDGKPVVLIHGWPLSADTWDDLANKLADNGYRAIAYDRRGFGRSDQPDSGYDYDTLASDLDAVLDEYGNDHQATLVGFSMGGGEVVRYLARHGTDRISHAALISSIIPYMLKTADNPDGVDQSVFDGITEGILADRMGFLQDFAKNFYNVGFIDKNVSQGVLDQFFNLGSQAGLRGTLGCAKAFSSTDFRQDCASVSVPTLIIHGTGDKVVPIDTSARQAARLIPQAELIELDGAPHGTLATNKDEIAAHLLKFLAGESRSAIGGGEADVADYQQTATLNPTL